VKRLLLIGAAALSLAACASGTSTTLAIAEGDTSVDVAYNGAAQAYLAALPTMSASTKATVKPLLVKAYAAVQLADAAAAKGDSATVSAQLTAVTALAAQIAADLK
jgi:hypothetical protein